MQKRKNNITLHNQLTKWLIKLGILSFINHIKKGEFLVVFHFWSTLILLLRGEARQWKMADFEHKTILKYQFYREVIF